MKILESYGTLKSARLRRLTLKEENGIRVADFVELSHDLPCKLVVQGMEIAFTYTGQQYYCFSSLDHTVKDCPQQKLTLPNKRAANRGRMSSHSYRRHLNLKIWKLLLCHSRAERHQHILTPLHLHPLNPLRPQCPTPKPHSWGKHLYMSPIFTK